VTLVFTGATAKFLASPSKHARELADDVGLMCVLARDPHLVPMAEALAARLLQSRPKL
jgi:hypothetical protein